MISFHASKNCMIGALYPCFIDQTCPSLNTELCIKPGNLSCPIYKTGIKSTDHTVLRGMK